VGRFVDPARYKDQSVTRILFLILTVAFSQAILVVRAQDAQFSPPAKRKFKYNGKVESTFDQSKDQSIVYFKLIPIKALEEPKETYAVQFSDERLEFTSYFAHQGQKLITPDWITLGFVSATENPQKYGDKKLAVKADGQWVDLGPMKVLSRTNYARRGHLPLIQDTMELPIRYQQFLMLANAKKIKVKLGGVEFDLEKEHLEAIRDLAAHTVP